MPQNTTNDVFVPATDADTLKDVSVGDFLRVEGLQSAKPRTWGGTVKKISRDEFGLYFTFKEPVEDGILWQAHASTTIDRITIVTNPDDQVSIIKTGNFVPKERPKPRIGGLNGQRHHGCPDGGDWTGHRIGHYSGGYRWGQCLYDDIDGNLWAMLDGDATVYTATPGEIFICEHERPCGTAA